MDSPRENFLHSGYTILKNVRIYNPETVFRKLNLTSYFLVISNNHQTLQIL